MANTDTIERKTIEELIALYDLEPHLKDIYVEGWSDKCFIEWFLEACGVSNVSVYDIDAVEIPDETLARYNLQIGCDRTCVIALSKEFDACLHGRSGLLCVVDRDYDDYVSSTSPGPYLRVTDYNSIELYALDKGAISKFLRVVLGNHSLAVEEHIKIILEICQDLFIFRVANICLNWNMRWLNPTRLVKTSRGQILFNRERFVERYLQQNGKWSRRSEYSKEVNRLKQIAASDVRRRIRGHDFTQIFYAVTKKARKKRRFGNVETFEGSLLACVEKEDLMEYGLFRAIAAL